MKQTISEIAKALIPIVTFTLVITSCHKSQTTPGDGYPDEPDANIPHILQVPEGNTLASEVYAKGSTNLPGST